MNFVVPEFFWIWPGLKAPVAGVDWLLIENPRKIASA